MVGAWEIGERVRLHDGREFIIVSIESRPILRNLIDRKVYVGHALVNGEKQFDFSGEPATDEFSGLDIRDWIG